MCRYSYVGNDATATLVVIPVSEITFYIKTYGLRHSNICDISRHTYELDTDCKIARTRRFTCMLAYQGVRKLIFVQVQGYVGRSCLRNVFIAIFAQISMPNLFTNPLIRYVLCKQHNIFIYEHFIHVSSYLYRLVKFWLFSNSPRKTGHNIFSSVFCHEYPRQIILN